MLRGIPLDKFSTGEQMVVSLFAVGEIVSENNCGYAGWGTFPVSSRQLFGNLFI